LKMFYVFIEGSDLKPCILTGFSFIIFFRSALNIKVIENTLQYS